MQIIEFFRRQPHKMAKHTKTILRLLPTKCLSVFDHFVGLAHERLKSVLGKGLHIFSVNIVKVTNGVLVLVSVSTLLGHQVDQSSRPCCILNHKVRNKLFEPSNRLCCLLWAAIKRK